ncbi:hypothetical protein BD410DRAFT_897205, partial [Rickenella mellea]
MSEGSIKTGTYTIENVNRGNHIVLKDSALVAGSSEHGKTPPSNALWKFTQLSNGRYTICAAGQNKKLACSDSMEKSAIVLGSNEIHWSIKGTAKKGEYLICHVTVAHELYWGIMYDDPGTPVILRTVATGFGNQWKFLGHQLDVYKPKPVPSRQFTGRSLYLQHLQQFFGQQKSRKGIRDFLLFGMGGVGKTQICLKFIDESSDLFWKIFWVDASNTDTIKMSFQFISNDLGISHCDTDGCIDLVIKWLIGVKHEWLLVFDNLDDDSARDMIARFSLTCGNVLYTSRNPTMQREVADSIEVSELDEEDAVTLLLKAAGLSAFTEEFRQQARPIVQELYCLPLAVDQAGAAILGGLCGIDGYLKLYSKHRCELLSHHSFQGASQYDHAVYGTWDLSFCAIETKAHAQSGLDVQAAQKAILILQISAFLHHENISERIFQQAAENLELKTSAFLD